MCKLNSHKEVMRNKSYVVQCLTARLSLCYLYRCDIIELYHLGECDS